jgi:hypothetical protein
MASQCDTCQQCLDGSCDGAADVADCHLFFVVELPKPGTMEKTIAARLNECEQELLAALGVPMEVLR